jgi:multidrug efflux system membrane fusion protein
MRKRARLAALVILLAAGLVSWSCRKGAEAQGQAGPPGKPAKPGAAQERDRISYPVEVESVETRSLIYTANAVGSIEAFEKVQVTARVAGVVDRVRFAEGNYAKVGQVLVEIEPERYKLAVEAAQASLEKAQASQADAEAGLKRREAVANQNPGLIPDEELATWRTKVRVSASDVAQAKAALDQANLNLRDAYVKAPFSGIIQTRTVQTGQYVQVGTILATLIRRDPLLLRFSVSERDASRLHAGMVANFKIRDTEREYKAKIVHVEASADETTRMVTVTAEIEDTKDESLRPGAFAEVSVPVSSPRVVPTVPQTAIRPSERGFIVFVVENNIAKERVITTGMSTADGQVEVVSGLAAGEILVVRGGEALRSGVPVKIAKSGAQPADASEPGPKKKVG